MGTRSLIEDHRRKMAQLTAEIKRLESLPAEPDYVPGIIYFEKRMGGKVYTYAAVRVEENGLWYTTGPYSEGPYAWDSLIDWIGEDTEVWVVTDFIRLEG